jgi:broad specificity phosphatase PhoE
VAGDQTTSILLIRHAHTAAVGHLLAGRTPGIRLTDRGRDQLAWLRGAVASWNPKIVYSSPLDRARETAEAIAMAGGIPLRLDDRLSEVDFGEWTGRTFADLEGLADWRLFNERRSTAIVPDGESAPAVQARIVSALEALARDHAGETVAAVSHADVIRAAILHYAGASLDSVHRIVVAPASVSIVTLGDEGPRILLLNWCEPPGRAS